jgi:hypothetical protein
LKQKKSKKCYNEFGWDPKSDNGQNKQDLGGLFAIHGILPRPNLLEEFLRTWESIKDGHITTIIYGEKITIDQTLIV